MKAQNFFEVAESLFREGKPEQEAMNRTMIGRWYYAVYHEVKEWLEEKFAGDLEISEGKTHERITFCCNSLQRKHKDLDFSKLGRLLLDLKNLRVMADYKLEVDCRRFDAEMARVKTKAVYEQLTILKQRY